MTEKPYQRLPENHTDSASTLELPWAGIGSRLGAYLVDILPITIGLAIAYHLLGGFGDSYYDYVQNGNDNEARVKFLSQRNQVRDLSLLIYLIYCTFAECSSMQGTFGKRLLGIRVTDLNGVRLSFGRSLGRNSAKLISYIPLCLGFMWAVFSKKKQGWHDMIAKTVVISSRGEPAED